MDANRTTESFNADLIIQVIVKRVEFYARFDWEKSHHHSLSVQR